MSNVAFLLHRTIKHLDHGLDLFKVGHDEPQLHGTDQPVAILVENLPGAKTESADFILFFISHNPAQHS
jgi:hypothetical protein